MPPRSVAQLECLVRVCRVIFEVPLIAWVCKYVISEYDNPLLIEAQSIPCIPLSPTVVTLLNHVNCG